ncbi:alpha/beta fold hydrolase [Dyadobacter subterraneus]|uniref:Alpha/beta hydrolase n=1 Tax=Dyadobacter subterraneus TaxID=2773304 RepID=A0ABR9WB15_9BACT|nr:alpha/beta hydrolase [Dyadobacter subterraneus]MBE9462647.1 alpha/beta hydrolase [Dyadobacter subterraneus]
MHNIDLNYARKGGGNTTTLVFLHYFGGSAQTWSMVTDQLADDFHCVAIDLCGFGNSPTTVWEVSVHEHAEYVANLLKELEIENYILIGHSMGGKIAAYLASKQTNINALILVAPSPPTPEPMDDDKRQEMLDTFDNRPAIEELVHKITAGDLSEPLFEKTVREHLQISEMGWTSWIEKGSREDISSRMSYINIPVTVISGSQDPNFSTSVLKAEFSKYFPEAVFIEIEGAGHLIPVETSEKLADLINEICQ